MDSGIGSALTELRILNAGATESLPEAPAHAWIKAFRRRGAFGGPVLAALVVLS